MSATAKTSIDISIRAEGRLVLTTEQLLEELSRVITDALNAESYHTLSKKTGVNVRTLYQLKNGNLSNPQIGTVLKILQALGKKLVIVDSR